MGDILFWMKRCSLVCREQCVLPVMEASGLERIHPVRRVSQQSAASLPAAGTVVELLVLPHTISFLVTFASAEYPGVMGIRSESPKDLFHQFSQFYLTWQAMCCTRVTVPFCSNRSHISGFEVRFGLQNWRHISFRSVSLSVRLRVFCQ